MTLREYYAGQALVGLLAGKTALTPEDYISMVRTAWTVADLLLAEAPQ